MTGYTLFPRLNCEKYVQDVYDVNYREQINLNSIVFFNNSLYHFLSIVKLFKIKNEFYAVLAAQGILVLQNRNNYHKKGAFKFHVFCCPQNHFSSLTYGRCCRSNCAQFSTQHAKGMGHVDRFRQSCSKSL